MKRNRIFDEGANRAVNRSTAYIAAKGVHYEPNKRLGNQPLWKTRPALKPVPQGFDNLTGRKFGRFTVIGLIGGLSTPRFYWVVRCACGNYETRRPKAIKNPKNNLDRCADCRHLLFLKRESYYFRTGKDKETASDD